MRRGFKTWAEQEAKECRALLGLSEWAPLDCRHLAAKLGILVRTPEELGMAPAHLTQLLEVDPDSWSGVTVVVEGHPVIVINPRKSQARQASDLAHELAHVRCGHIATGRQYVDYVDFPLRPFDAEQEEEAVWLSGSLLLPRPALLKACYRWSDEEVADRYGVSVEMVKYRKNVTGVGRQLSRLR